MKLFELFESVSDHEDWRNFKQISWNPYGVKSAGGRMLSMIYKEIGYVPINNKTSRVLEAGGVGTIVPGVNTTSDVGPKQTEIEAAKFFARSGVNHLGKRNSKRKPKIK